MPRNFAPALRLQGRETKFFLGSPKLFFLSIRHAPTLLPGMEQKVVGGKSETAPRDRRDHGSDRSLAAHPPGASDGGCPSRDAVSSTAFTIGIRARMVRAAVSGNSLPPDERRLTIR